MKISALFTVGASVGLGVVDELDLCRVVAVLFTDGVSFTTAAFELGLLVVSTSRFLRLSGLEKKRQGMECYISSSFQKYNVFPFNLFSSNIQKTKYL